MKSILCFGDSNTYGYIPDGSGRYDFSVRYPGRLQSLLGSGYRVIEEGCPGRTTVHEDPYQPFRKGSDYIVPCLLSHMPIDFVVVMLGTNDCKSVFRATSDEISRGLSAIIESIKTVAAASADILIVAPIQLGDNIGKPGYDPDFDESSRLTSKALACAYQKLADETGCRFLDASRLVQASPVDEEHLDEFGHRRLAEAVAQIIRRTAE